MPLWKTLSKEKRQVIQPKTWTWVNYDGKVELPLPSRGWSIMESMIRVHYPETGCPTTVKIRLARWPGTKEEDLTGHTDFDPLPGNERHIHWQHFLLNRPNLTIAMKIWHDGSEPIVLSGRQFKTTRFK
jgi:hypothetical protein